METSISPVMMTNAMPTASSVYIVAVLKQVTMLSYVRNPGAAIPVSYTHLVAGNGYEMTAIAACVLGGISLSGGLGNVIGAAIGAVIMSSIGRLLVFIGLPSTYNNTITGTMLIVIVVIDALAQRRSIEMTRRKRLLSRTADQEGGAKA